MNNVTKKVWDDVSKTCSFLTSVAALYLATRAFENHVIGSDHLGNNSLGRAVDKFFDGGKKTGSVSKA